jgi:starch synthase
MLTIHNLAFQGNFALESAEQIGIPAASADWRWRGVLGQAVLPQGRHPLLRLRLHRQPNYAQEIMTPRFGCGMDGILSFRKLDLRAIPNAIDAELWNPADDPLIARNFSVGNMKGKSSCKRDLQKLFGLPIDPFAPVMGLGSRMSHQKMADVVSQSLPGIMERHPRLQVVVLGCGDHDYEGFPGLAERYPGRIAVHIGYDERRAHALHAGSDMLLHPTRFEPFGLTPLYAMRYGAIPIGSRVGGLVDTVCDADLDPQRATGVLFDGDTVDDMQHAVTRAFALYSDTERWQAMQRNAMASTATGPGRPAPISRPTPMWPTWQYGPCSYRARCRWSGPPTPQVPHERLARPAAAIAAALANVVGRQREWRPEPGLVCPR